MTLGRESRHLSGETISADTATSGSVAQQMRVFYRRLPAPLYRPARYLWTCWSGFVLLLLAFVGKVPSHHLRRFAYRFLFGIRIGAHSSIHIGARFLRPRAVSIGDNCVLGNGIFLDGRAGLSIGNRVVTGSEVMIHTLQHDMDSPDFAAEGGPVVIGDYVYIGPRVIVLPNVQIGYGAVVAAGAVVTKDVPPYTVVGGIPARKLRERSHDLTYVPIFAAPFQ